MSHFCRRCGLGPLAASLEKLQPHQDSSHVHAGRHLCQWCHKEARRNGTLLDYPRVTRSTVDLLEDVEVLLHRTDDLAEMAQLLGMKYDSLYQALRRARAAGAAVRMVHGRIVNVRAS